MSSMRCYLFGKLRVQCGEHVTDGLGARKLEELFCYLLLQRGHSHPRGILADLFWGDNPTALSRKYLRKALWQLQESLEAHAALMAESILLVEPEWVQLNPKADLWIDITAFEEGYRRVQGVSVELLSRQQIQELQDAVALYGGELLEGWYMDWCLFERERYRFMYLAMLDKLMDYCEIHHHYEAGIAHGMSILRCDRAQERTHRRLMRMHYLGGDRTAALRQYGRCVAALHEELDVLPAQSTVELCQLIREDRFQKPPIQLEDEKQEPMADLTGSTALLERFKTLHEELMNVQHWLKEAITIMEGAPK
jgi:DNA-binding SARP family transcriptional activator